MQGETEYLGWMMGATHATWLDFKSEIEADYSYPLTFGFERTWNRAWSAGRESRGAEVKRLRDALETISGEAQKFDLVYIEELALVALSEQE